MCFACLLFESSDTRPMSDGEQYLDHAKDSKVLQFPVDKPLSLLHNTP